MKNVDGNNMENNGEDNGRDTKGTAEAQPILSPTSPTSPASPKPRNKQKNHFFLYFTCFSTGAIILILEILGFRLFAPYFGNSIYVSGSLIGVILGTLSAGYYFGGKVADKHPRERVLYYLIFFSGIYLSGIYLSYNAILKYFQGWSLTFGTVFSTVAVFGVPMILLSTVSPYLIKLLAHEDKLGQSSGNIFSISTIGSISGSFLATFFLLPFLGSKITLVLCILSLLVLATLGLAKSKPKNYALLIFALLLIAPPYTPAEENLIHETESSYNLIRIYEEEGMLSMVLNSPQWRQSYKPDVKDLKKTYREYFLLAPYLASVNSVLVLGMSAGASVQEFKYFYNVSIDAVEIDPKVVELAEIYFDVKEDKHLRIYTADAKNFVKSSADQYDFIEIDLFQGGPEMPFYVATEEFFSQVFERTTNQGIVMMNVLGEYNNPQNEELVRTIANTFSKVYSNVFLLPLQGNSILIATKEKTTLPQLKEKLQSVKTNELMFFAKIMEKNLVAHMPNQNKEIFSDDKAPVELIIHRILEFI